MRFSNFLLFLSKLENKMNDIEKIINGFDLIA